MLLLPHHLRTHSCWWCFSVEPVVVVVNGTNMMTVAIGGGGGLRLCHWLVLVFLNG